MRRYLVLGFSLLSLFLILANVEVAKLISLLIAGNNVEPVTELVLLQELLSQILQVTLGVSNAHTSDSNLATAGITANLNGVTKLTSFAINLELVMEEVLKGGSVEDGVLDGATAVNNELAGLLASGSSGDALQG